jgi:hypothetical protein
MSVAEATAREIQFESTGGLWSEALLAVRYDTARREARVSVHMPFPTPDRRLYSPVFGELGKGSAETV